MATNLLQKKMQKLNDWLISHLVERDEFVKGCLLAILSKKNLFVIGTPGTAKSYATELICRAINGLVYFEYLLGAFTKPEEVFGPYDISALKGTEKNSKSKYVRITDGRLPEAHIGFLDEIWKASSSILNDLLRISDETRRFYNPKPERTPLMSLFGASNELPQDDSLNALYDRFHLRYVVTDIADDANFLTLLNSKVNGSANKDAMPTLTGTELLEMQKQVENMPIPQPVLECIATLRGKLNMNGFIFSPRRWCEALQVLRAHAWFEGRNEVGMEDLSILCNMLWNKPEERKSVCSIILSATNPEMTAALEIMDTAQEIHAEAIKQGTSGAGHEANDKFKELFNRLAMLNQSSRVKEITAKMRSMQREILDKCLDMTS